MCKKIRTFGQLLLAALCLTLLACKPVVPVVTYDEWQFEGLTVISHVPERPIGIVYFFHGSYGSAAMARKIEVVDTTNELIARGYAVVTTESVLRTGNKRWAVHNPSLTENPDLARLTRLHALLVNSTRINWRTPIFGIGMSNGARMVSLFGRVFSDAGYPVAAIAPFMGKVAPTVRSSGGLRIPAFFVTAQNDTVTTNSVIQEDYEMALLNGVAALFYEKPEEPLLSGRFTRIPAIDENQATRLYDLLFSTGAWDKEGQRILTMEETEARYSRLSLPPQLAANTSAIKSQIQAMLAQHEFVGLYKLLLADFFDANLPTTTNF